MSADLLALCLRVVLVSSAAILVVLALRAPMRRAFGARVAYALWALAPIATLAAFLPARLVLIDAPQAQSAPTPVAQIAEAAQATAPALTAPLEASLTRPDLSPLIAAIWFAGFLASLAVLAIGQQRFMARLRLQRASHGVHVAAQETVGPAVIGVIAPRIVVPADFEARYTAQERELVLAHERAHISAGDVQVNALAALAQCVFWFNPLVYAARAALRIDQELACDERVMQRHAHARRAYAEAMLKTQLAARAVPLGCAWPPAGAKPLKQRIAALGRPHVALSRRILGGALCVSATLIVALAAWIAQPPRRAYANEVESSFLVRTSELVEAVMDGGSSGADLVQALMDGDVAQARALIAAGANVNHWTPGDGTPLIMAARLGDVQLAQELLAAGADVNQAARGEGNALIVASRRGDLDMARLFVRAGADVNAIVPADETPLIQAAWNGRIEVARYLINHGADVNLAVRAPTVDGAELRSPLQMARREGHTDMVALLQAAGATN